SSRMSRMFDGLEQVRRGAIGRIKLSLIFPVKAAREAPGKHRLAIASENHENAVLLAAPLETDDAFVGNEDQRHVLDRVYARKSCSLVSSARSNGLAAGLEL